MANPTLPHPTQRLNHDGVHIVGESFVVDGKVVVKSQEATIADAAATTMAATALVSNHGFVRFSSTKDVSADTGGGATEAALVTIPARSIIYCVECETLIAMNGGTSSSFEVGINGNTDLYIDITDYDPGTVDTLQASLAGTSNNQKVPLYSKTAVDLVTAHINDGSATTGSVKTTVVYQVLSSIDLDTVDTQLAAVLVDLDAHKDKMNSILTALENHGILADA